ncbi:MAG: DNA translocase FtsK 4TM domain-containing protein, partial [Patescibacteria group bacterium]
MVRRRNRNRTSRGIMSLITGEPSSRRITRSGVRRRARAGTGIRFEVETHVAQEIFAVIYLALSFLILLSIYGQLGAVGSALHGFLRPVFGFGIHFIPVVFFGVSLTLFFAKRSPFTLARITGLVLLFTSLLSIFHLSVPQDDMLRAAQAGEFGGYIGFVGNFFFRSVLQIGNLGASIIFVATFIVGVLLTFEFSMMNWLREAKPEIHLERRKRFAVTDDGIVEVPDEAITDLDESEFEEEQEINIIKPQISADAQEDSAEAPRDEDDEENEEGAENQNEAADDGEPVKAKKTNIVWQLPSLDLLDNPLAADAVDDDYLKEKAEMIRTKLEQFGISVAMSDVHVGPTVIQYTLKPHEGVKLSKITTLKNDLALALAAKAIRIEAPIPGKALVGIEIPNENRTVVRLREILDSDEWKDVHSNLRMPLGRAVNGKPMVIDLCSMPHMLIAGATGSGKSVGMNSFLISLLYQNSPQELKLIMIDPKRVELNTYNGIPHLLTPVITDLEKAAISLKWAVAEMNRRYIVLSETGHRNIADYNGDPAIEEKLPKFLVVIDELADLMMAAGKEV